jgi:hypothetical protein
MAIDPIDIPELDSHGRCEAAAPVDDPAAGAGSTV